MTDDADVPESAEAAVEAAEPSDPRDSAPEAERAARVWTAAPLTAWAVAFVLLRIFAVSGYDWDTAFLVSTTLNLSDAIGLAFGTFMGGHVLVEILLVFLLPLLLTDFLWASWGRRPLVVIPMGIGMVALVAITVTYRNWWLLVGTVAVFALLVLTHGMHRETRMRRALGVAMRRVGLITGLGVLVMCAFMTTPWVPEEEIETTGEPITGYVLSVDSGYLNILTEDQEFLILTSDDVVSRS